MVVLVIVEMASPCINKEDKIDVTNYAHLKLKMWVQLIHNKSLWDIVQGHEEMSQESKVVTQTQEDSFVVVGMNLKTRRIMIPRHTWCLCGPLQRRLHQPCKPWIVNSYEHTIHSHEHLHKHLADSSYHGHPINSCVHKFLYALSLLPASLNSSHSGLQSILVPNIQSSIPARIHEFSFVIPIDSCVNRQNL